MNATVGRSFVLTCATTIFVLVSAGCGGGGGSTQAPLPGAAPLTVAGKTAQALASPEAAYPSGTPWPIPGTFDFDNYDTGGQGVGYNTTVTTNQGGQYRHDGVSIASAVNAPGSNGYYVGWNDAGDWYHYTVNVQSSATYSVAIVVDSGTTGSTTGTFHIEDKTGKNLTGEISVPVTGSWNSNWETVKANAALSAGANVLKVVIDSGQGLFNLNFMTFSTGSTPTPTPTATPTVAPTATPTATAMPSVTIGTSTSLLGPGVTAADFTMVTPAPQVGSINAPIFAYDSQYSGPGMPYLAQNTEIPMFVPFDRDDSIWWDEMLDELTFARTPFTLLHGRGCFDPSNAADDTGNGNMCPHLLTNMVAAVNRAGLGNVAKFGMFIDTGVMPGFRTHFTGVSGPMDLTPVPDSAGHLPSWYFWDADTEIFFDTIPKSMWYLFNNNGTLEPVITMWSLSSTFFSNQPNNANLLLQTISADFQARYGMTPCFNLDVTWTALDPSLVNSPLICGMNGWFIAGGPGYTVLTLKDTASGFNGRTFGGMVPSYEPGDLPNGNPIGAGTVKGEIDRNHGATFVNGFTANANSVMTVVEGFDDILEDAGSYRSDNSNWDYTNEYLDLLRQYSDPGMESVKFQAESADVYLNATNKPATTFRYNMNLGIIPLGTADQGVGWALSSTTPGEALEYENVVFPAATYKFTARVSSAVAGNSLHFSIDSTSLPAVAVPNTGNAQTYVVVDLGTVPMTSGPHTLTLTLDTGSVNVDWFFAKRQ